MINSLIVDNEQKGIEVLRMLLEQHCPDVKVIAVADDVDKAVQQIELHHPPLVFLDIEMGGESGFDLLEKIKERDFHVIFVTAHSHFAVKAFRFSVVDYLLKPVDIDELKQAVLRVKGLIDAAHSDTAQEGDFDPVGKQTLRIPSTEGTAFVYLMNIIRMEADGAYTHIYIDKGKHYISSYNLGQFEEHLDASLFMRVHRSHLINLEKIKSVNRKNGLFANMSDGTAIEIAKRNRADFIKKIH